MSYIPSTRVLDIEMAQRSFGHFVKYTKSDYEANWHHDLICKTLDVFLDPNSGLDRLIIEAPPRTGKSELVSRRFPAYAFGKYPKHQIVLASYASSLAQRMNRDVQRVIDSESYHEVFPETRLSSSNVAKSSHGAFVRTSDLFEIVDYAGAFRSVGVGGGLTGSGADIALIDDPIKDWKEASSKTIKDNLLDWYQSVLYTRLSKFGKVCVMSTRWAEDDLSGRLLNLAKSDREADQWHVLRLPMIQEISEYTHVKDTRDNGELLWESRFPEKKVNAIKRSVGSRVWAALYQQRPAPDEGNLVQRDWWKYYTVRPPIEFFDYISMTWDFTFKGTDKSDFVVGQVWGRKGSMYYLLDQVRDRMNFSSTVQAVRALAAKWPKYREIIVEEKANGAAVIDTLKKEIRGIVAYNPKDSKEARASSVTPLIEAGNVWLPDPSIAPWINDYIEEWAVFPNGANDDQIDATAQMLIRFSKSKGFLEMLSTEEDLKVGNVSQEFMDMFWKNGKKSALNF